MGKIPLDKDVESFVYKCGTKARESMSAGDFDSAEKFYLEAWSALPYPKESHDHAHSISVAVTKFYREMGETEKSLSWLKKATKAYGNSTAGEASLGFLLATILYEGGRFDQAYEEFDKLFKKYNKRPFQGEKNEYLEFYLNKRVKEGGGDEAS